MRTVRSGFQLRMCLSGNEPWMRRDFYHLYDPAVRRKSAQRHSVCFQYFTVIVIYFIAVTVTFMDLFCAI